jgi:tryptophanyl-tRNA synthetase
MLTGDRPTGPLHLGHYVGSLRMRISLQEKIETFVLIADLHVLTTRTHDLEEIGHNIRECVWTTSVASIRRRPPSTCSRLRKC